MNSDHNQRSEMNYSVAPNPLVSLWELEAPFCLWKCGRENLVLLAVMQLLRSGKA